ncbi:MAG: YjbQ family protein [Ignavibacteriales bacterium]|nr:YjbQ family protein [Ignavibacteriales bacterium]
MTVLQTEIRLPQMRRGFHLITEIIHKAIDAEGHVEKGICNLCIQHTSASLTLNENADPSVRRDFEIFFNHLVPENFPRFTHTYEGSDDMPAHIKASIMGATLNIPVKNNRLLLGTWQGIYLCEHRDSGGSRKIVITVIGS